LATVTTALSVLAVARSLAPPAMKHNRLSSNSLQATTVNRRSGTAVAIGVHGYWIGWTRTVRWVIAASEGICSIREPRSRSPWHTRTDLSPRKDEPSSTRCMRPQLKWRRTGRGSGSATGPGTPEQICPRGRTSRVAPDACDRN
jgi:hypothetical protein